MKLGFILFILALCTRPVTAQVSAEKNQLNLGFEVFADTGLRPDVWKMYGKGHDFKADLSEKLEGQASLSIESRRNRSTNDSIALVANSVHLVLKGNVIHFSGYLKLDHIVGRVGLSLMINGERGQIATEEMKTSNLNGTKPWKKYSIDLPLPDSAKSIYFAVYQIGNGKLWVDNLKLSIDGQDLSTYDEQSENAKHSGAKLDETPLTAEEFSSEYGKVIVSASQLNDSVSSVSNVPASFHFNPYYQKYLNAAGLPIIGSASVSDKAFYKTREILLMMLRKSPVIKAKMIENNARIAIIGKSEDLTDLPEYNNMDKWIDQRARGLGGLIDFPLTSCAEENVLGLSTDRYDGEDILIHEFAHTMHMLGISFIDKDFNDQLQSCYTNALNQGLWKNTYAISSVGEYFAEGVQSWFNVNKDVKTANGINNEIDTHEELKLYDPRLYKLISSYFNNEQNNKSIHFGKKINRKWMPWEMRQ